MAYVRLLLGVLFIACFSQVYGETKVFTQDESLHFKSLLDAFDEDDNRQEKPHGSYLNNEDVKQDMFLSPDRRIIALPWWSNFVLNLIYSFNQQQTNSQFGVLYFDYIDEELAENPDLNPDFFPNINGEPMLDNSNALTPSTLSSYGNYIAARPERSLTEIIHSEEKLLRQMGKLWNAYLNSYNRSPNVIILYSWFIPCNDCTSMILNYFNQQPYADVPVRVVAYTRDYSPHLPSLNPTNNNNNIQRLRSADITTWQEFCRRPEEDIASEQVSSSTTETCDLDETFQGCMITCLEEDFCCSCKSDKKKTMVTAVVNDLTKTCAASDMIKCASTWFNKEFSRPRSGASSCFGVDTARSKVQSCSKKCLGRPLSEPLNPEFPSSYPKLLTKLSDIERQPNVDLSSYCEDVRTEGFLCNVYSSDSFTAGNTMCRKGWTCGFHNYTSYSWCYVDYSNKWDYCCTGTCDYHHRHYLWCKSGAKWQYCGDAGHVTAKGRTCLPQYPCGMHQETGKASKYWCYVDTNKNWDWCCQPGDHCSYKGKNYRWCWTGYKEKTSSIKC